MAFCITNFKEDNLELEVIDTEENGAPSMKYEENLEFMFKKSNTLQCEGEERNLKDVVLWEFVFLDKSISPALIYTLPGLGLRFQCWTAAPYLSKYLESHQYEFFPAEKGKLMRILELGAGTGIVGIVAAKLFGSQVHVTVTDVTDVVPNMKKNIEINYFETVNITAAPLVWGEKITDPEFLQQDYILASDVIYYEELFEILIQTLFELTESGRAKIFICEEKRKKVENRFWKRIAKYFVVKSVEQIKDKNCRHGYVTIYLLIRKENSPLYWKP